MKIIIYDDKSLVSYNPNDLLTKGLGGAETCIINLAKALNNLGHDVDVFVNCNQPGNYNGVWYHNTKEELPKKCDLFIGVESFPEKKIYSKKVINWVHRPYSHEVKKFDVEKIVCVSEWQKKFLDDPRTIVIENGIDDIYFQEGKSPKISGRIIYAGHPRKGGMAVLPKIFLKLKETLPGVDMIVCGSGRLWGDPEDEYQSIYNQLTRVGINYLGSVGNIVLSNLLQSSSVLINPIGSKHRETFGLVVAQAMASGCIPVSSGEGNLSHLIENCGFSIFGDVNSDEWISEACGKIFEIMTSPTKVIRDRCRDKARQFTWEKSARKFIELCQK